MDINYKIFFTTISILSLLLVFLSINVIKNRRSYMVLYGAGGHIILKAAIRAQANLIEYVPLTLFLFYGLIYFNINNYLFGLLCCIFIIARLSHSLGVLKFERHTPPVLYPRFYGMVGTFAVILFSAGYLLINVIIN